MKVEQDFASRLASQICNMPRDSKGGRATVFARDAILDTIGVMLAGSVHDSLRIAAKSVEVSALAGECPVLGTSLKTNPLDAALLNGIAGHALDYDDSNYHMLGHPSAVILPAMISVASGTQVSGSDFLHAFTVGYEVAARFGQGVANYQYVHGWHPTATIGIFAAVASAGLLKGVGSDDMATALRIAVSMAGGVKSNFGSMTKHLHVGLAGRNALLALELAKHKFTAKPAAFEHDQGYFNVFNFGEGNYDTSIMLANWAKPHSIIDVGVSQKRFPCCYACLAPIDALLAILDENEVALDDIGSIRCSVHPARFPHINNANPANGLEAKFSIHYCLARAATSGRLDIRHFEDDALGEQQIRKLMPLVSFGVIQDSANIMEADVELTLKDGRQFTKHVDHAIGSTAEAKLSEDQLRTKFRDCAGIVLSESRVGKLEEELMSMENLPDMQSIFDLAKQIK